MYIVVIFAFVITSVAGAFDDAKLAATYDQFPFLYTRRKASFQHCEAAFAECEPALASEAVTLRWHTYDTECISSYCSCLPSGQMNSEGVCSYARPSEDDMCGLVEYCVPTLDLCIRRFEAQFPSECEAFRNCTNSPEVAAADTAQCVSARSQMYPKCNNNLSCSMHPTLRQETRIVVALVVGMTLLCVVLACCALRYLVIRRYMDRARGARRHGMAVRPTDQEMEVLNPTPVLRVSRSQPPGACEKCKKGVGVQMSVPCMCVACAECGGGGMNEYCVVCQGEVLTVISLAKVYAETDVCVVCMDHTTEVMCAPCGHYALCGACSERVADLKPVCPLCREAVTVMCTMPAPEVHTAPQV